MGSFATVHRTGDETLATVELKRIKIDSHAATELLNFTGVELHKQFSNCIITVQSTLCL